MDQNADLRQQLNEAKAGGHFIFVPSTPLPKINGLFVPVLEIVRLNPDDFYLAQGNYGIHHHAAMKLADAAGIQWAADHGRVGREDNMGNPSYCSFRVVGRYRTVEGLWAEVAGHKHINLDAKRAASEEKYRTQFSFKVKDGKKPWPDNEADYIKVFSDRDVNQIRETMNERCESGAQSRVVRNILHLPVSFKGHSAKGQHDGIVKRFYIVRYILDPANPQVQAVQLASFQQAVLGVYGAAPAPIMIASRREAVEDVPEPEMDPSVTDFENSSPEDQEAIIMGMIKDFDYPHFERDMKGNKDPLSGWDQGPRTDYFRHILSRRP